VYCCDWFAGSYRTSLAQGRAVKLAARKQRGNVEREGDMAIVCRTYVGGCLGCSRRPECRPVVVVPSVGLSLALLPARRVSLACRARLFASACAGCPFLASDRPAICVVICIRSARSCAAAAAVDRTGRVRATSRRVRLYFL